MPTRRLQEETCQRPARLYWGKQSPAVAGQEGVWVGPETHVNVSSKNLTQFAGHIYPRRYSWCSFPLESELTPGPERLCQ